MLLRNSSALTRCLISLVGDLGRSALYTWGFLTRYRPPQTLELKVIMQFVPISSLHADE